MSYVGITNAGTDTRDLDYKGINLLILNSTCIPVRKKGVKGVHR